MKKLATITAIVFGMFFFLAMPASTVSASGGIECREVPGQYGSTNVSPYGSVERICDTGIVFSNVSSAIGTEAALALGGVFLVGSLLTLNGKLLKTRVN